MSAKRSRAIALVSRPGPARAAAERALARLGRVRTFGDPYEATAHLARAGADVVVVSLRGWRRGDLRFVSWLRSRSRRVSVLLLVPAGKRSLAVAALRVGADGYVVEPFARAEVVAACRALLRRAGPRRRSGAAASRLTGEIAHAVNNPLQVMGLLLDQARETGTAPGEWLERLEAEAARIREVVDVLGAYGRLSRPATAPLDLGALLRETVDRAASAGVVEVEGPRAAPGATALADATQVGRALEALVRLLAARSERPPAALRSAARPVPDEEGRFVEAALRVRGVHLGEEEWEALRRAVLVSDERTRAVHPGLALPSAVALAHGGALSRRAGRRGTVVALRLPSGNGAP